MLRAMTRERLLDELTRVMAVEDSIVGHEPEFAALVEAAGGDFDDALSEWQIARGREVLAWLIDQHEPLTDLQNVVRLLLHLSTPHALGSELHGPEHWRRVAVAGLQLAQRTPGIDRDVVFRFAVLHDSQRLNDHEDPGHGARAAELAPILFDTDEQCELLAHACAHHDTGAMTDEPTIGACWDSDRLQLWRVGIEPDPAMLNTPVARAAETIAWAERLQLHPAPTWAELADAYAW